MARKLTYSKSLSRIVARNGGTLTKSGRYHVIANTSNGWSVVSVGKVRPVRVFESQAQAVAYAKTIAKQATGKVMVHGETGQLSDNFAY